MSKDILAKLNRLAGSAAAKVDQAPAATAVATPEPPKVSAATWADELEAELAEADDPETFDAEEDESSDSDLPSTSHRDQVYEPEPANAVHVQASVQYSDAMAARVAELVVAKLRDALNSIVL